MKANRPTKKHKQKVARRVHLDKDMLRAIWHVSQQRNKEKPLTY